MFVLGADVDLGDVLRARTVLGLRLRLHAIDPAEFHEVVDVEVAEIGLQGVEDFGNGHAERLGPFPVHVERETRGAHAKAGPDGPNRRVLFGLRDELLGDGGESLEVPPGGILDLHREPTRCPQPADRGRVEGQDLRLGDLREFPECVPDERLDVLIRARAFIPEAQGSEHGRRIGAAGAEHEILADQDVGAMDLRNGEIITFELAHDLRRPLP